MEDIVVDQLRPSDSLLKSTPEAKHYTRVIRDNARLLYNGEVIGVYIKVPREETRAIRAVAKSTQYTKGARARAGLPTKSSVYGALPRVPIRQDYCRFTNQSKNNKVHFAASFRFAEVIDKIYQEHLPEEREKNIQVVTESIHSDWRVNDTPFTTCNFNVNHAIKYHRDLGNIKNVFSNVLILKSGVTGGELVFPEFGLAFEQSDCALGIFDGQKWIHGVMPIQKTQTSGYRASIVFYAMAGMKHCYPYKMELERFQKRRTHVEEERAKGNPNLREELESSVIWKRHKEREE